MKVLYLTNIPTPYRIDFFNELSKYCDLTVLFERKYASNRNEEWLNNRNFSFNAVFLKGVNIGVEGAFCPNIRKFIKEESFDIIIVGGYSTATGMYLIKYLRKKKISFILNCDGAFKKQDGKVKYFIKKYFISSASYYITTSKKSIEYLKYYGANEKKIFLYPFSSILEKDILENLVDKQVKKNLKKELKISEKNVVLSVGQFIKRKGFDILIKASKNMLPNTGVYIIGDNPSEEYIDLVNNLEIKNVHFINFLQKKELKKYYMVADVFAFPTREDIWGLVVNEAISQGLPVVSTSNCNAALELLDNGKNGYIVQVEDIDELSRKINTILKDENLKENMAIKSIKKAKEYTIEKMAKRHYEIFKIIINNREKK